MRPDEAKSIVCRGSAPHVRLVCLRVGGAKCQQIDTLTTPWRRRMYASIRRSSRRRWWRRTATLRMSFYRVATFCTPDQSASHCCNRDTRHFAPSCMPKLHDPGAQSCHAQPASACPRASSVPAASSLIVLDASVSKHVQVLILHLLLFLHVRFHVRLDLFRRDPAKLNHRGGQVVA